MPAREEKPTGFAAGAEFGLDDESFAAIDFETATSSRDSACALGLTVFKRRVPIIRRKFLIRPPGNRYDPFNTSIHGMGPSDTVNAPKFPVVWDQVTEMIEGLLVVAHNTAFDMSVFRRCAMRHEYSPGPFQFACTYRLARSMFPHAVSWRLPNLAQEFDIPLIHHDPVSDAEAAGLLWLSLARHADISHAQLLKRLGYRLGRFTPEVYKPFSNARPPSRRSKRRYKPLSAKHMLPQSEPDPDGILFGCKIVFTGKLASMPRREAFQLAVDAGARPTTTVSRFTDYLVTGMQHLSVVGESGLSSKHRKALDLNARGIPIGIIDEDDFMCLLAGDSIGDSPPASMT